MKGRKIEGIGVSFGGMYMRSSSDVPLKWDGIEVNGGEND